MPQHKELAIPLIIFANRGYELKQRISNSGLFLQPVGISL